MLGQLALPYLHEQYLVQAVTVRKERLGGIQEKTESIEIFSCSRAYQRAELLDLTMHAEREREDVEREELGQ